MELASGENLVARLGPDDDERGKNQRRLLQTGIVHVDDQSRVGWTWSVYIPESYRSSSSAAAQQGGASASYPLIVAMHGGNGRHDDMLLSWLATARRNRAFLLSPKSVGRTWPLNGDPTQDAISIGVQLHQILSTYPAVDRQRIYLTGMSDGGTFCYILSLVLPQVFAGVAPAAAFPILAQIPPDMLSADAPLREVPLHHVHGTTDWMFAISRARKGDENARRAGLEKWKFTELPWWTHASPMRVNEEVIWPWFASLPPNPRFADGDLVPLLKELAERQKATPKPKEGWATPQWANPPPPPPSSDEEEEE